jgi:hypothetical protein
MGLEHIGMSMCRCGLCVSSRAACDNCLHSTLRSNGEILDTPENFAALRAVEGNKWTFEQTLRGMIKRACGALNGPGSHS